MLHPLLDRPPSRVRTLLIILAAPLALLGVAFAGHIFLIPLWLAISLWPTGPTRWAVFAVTLLWFCFLAQRSVRETRLVWQDTKAIALDQLMLTTGCVIWSAVAVLIVSSL